MKKKILYLAFTAIALTACSNDETIKNTDETLAELRFSASMDVAMTRAASTIQASAMDGDCTPAVFVYRHGTTASTDGYGYVNVAADGVATTGATPTLTYTTTPLYYPQDKGAIDVYMYAPYVASASSANLTTIPVTVATDQSAKAGYLASDFLHGWNKGATTDGGTTYAGIPYPAVAGTTVGVDLVHDLCKIILNISAGSGASIAAADVKSVTLGNNDILTSATVDITAATYDGTNSKVAPTANATTITSGTGSTVGTITFADNSTAQTSVAAIIPPQTLNGVALKVTIGTTDYTATLSSPDTDSDTNPDALVAGNQYTYNVTVDLKGLIITATSISPWANGSATNPISVQ